MSKLPTLIEMLQSGMHFGHTSSRWHPKMKPFIYGEKSGIHIIDLEKTQFQLERALTLMKEIVSRGGVILFVGTKIQAKDIVRKYAESCDMPFVTERWLGGTLTNFHQLKETLKRLKMLKDQREKGELKKYTKKEQIILGREIEEKEKKVGGIQHLTRIPDAIFVIDIRTEKTAVQEANATHTKVIALCDTNVNPSGVDAIIPGNDDATKSIELVCKLACESIKEGKANAAKVVADKVLADKVVADQKAATEKVVVEDVVTEAVA